MSKKLLFILLSLLLIVAAYLLWPKQVSQHEAPPPAGVRVAEVQMLDLPEQATAFGTLYAKHDAKLRSEISGMVKKIDQVSGSQVTAGALLLSFDGKAQLANLHKAESAVALSRAEYDRVKTLVAGKVLPSSDQETKKNALDAALADLEVAKDVLAKMSITAPFAGKLGIWQVNEGDFVQAGTNLVELVDNRVLRVRYSLPERFLSRIALGQQVAVTSSAYPELVFTGKVAVISPMVDPESRNIELEAEIDNQQALLYPGLSAEIGQKLGLISGGIAVPEESVTYSIEGAAVYRLQQHPESDLAKVERVVVEVGIPVNGMVPVRHGLQAGDYVVTEGLQKIRDGQEVQVLPAVESTGTSAAAELVGADALE